MKTNNNELFHLDNAAKIYPAAMTKKWNSVYRVSAYLKYEIDEKTLKQAVEDLAPRFPTFYVQLAKTPLWFMLKKVYNYDIVEKEKDVCRPMNVGTDDRPMFRVLYNQNKISVELFHSITDGTGAVIYLKTLTARYLELCGFSIEKGNGVLDIHDLPKDEETRDAFQALYKKGLGASRKEADAYRYDAEIKKDYFKTISGIIPIDQLKMVTKNIYKCTITEYLVAVLAYSFYNDYLKKHKNIKAEKPIKISVPINLRPYFDAQTLRNFASFVNVDVYPSKVHNFNDILNVIREKMATMITKDKLHKAVSQNVSEEKMFISKYSPNFLKVPVMKACYHIFGDKKYTATLSNIGLIKVPDSMASHVERFDFVLCGGGHNPVNCAVIGFKNTLTVSFSSTTEVTDIEDFFFDTLRRDGIKLTTALNGVEIKAA